MKVKMKRFSTREIKESGPRGQSGLKTADHFGEDRAGDGEIDPNETAPPLTENDAAVGPESGLFPEEADERVVIQPEPSAVKPDQISRLEGNGADFSPHPFQRFGQQPNVFPSAVHTVASQPRGEPSISVTG